MIGSSAVVVGLRPVSDDTASGASRAPLSAAHGNGVTRRL